MSNIDRLKTNTKAAIATMQDEGVSGCSLANLKQMTPTAGLTFTPAAFHIAFDAEAGPVAKACRFRLR